MLRLLALGAAPMAIHHATPIQAQELLRPRTEEVFTAGWDEERVFFGFLTAMAMAEDGTLVVFDSDPGGGHFVTVFSPDGDVVAQWGVLGDGPGDLTGGPAAVAIAGDTVLLAGPVSRMGLYTFSGEELARTVVPLGPFTDASLVNGTVIAWKMDFQIDGAMPVITAVLGPGDGQATWATRPLAGMNTLNPLKSLPVLATLPGGRLAVGFGDEYVLHLVAAESGDTLGLVAREVQRRTQADGEALLERAIGHSARPDEAPEGWSSVVNPYLAVGPPPPGHELSLPLIRKAFWGPPGALWIERGLGLHDEHAAPLDRPDDSLLWDIFGVNDDHTSEYLGTVALPSGFRVAAANAERVAGVVLDDVGRQAVRVLRVTMPGP